jgi:hypothetical protein
MIDARESDIQRAGMRILKTVYGVPCWRRNTGAMSGEHRGKSWHVRFGVPGMSDVWGFYPVGRGWRHFEWEVKRRGAKPTELQTEWLRKTNEYTGAAFWTDNTLTMCRVMEALMAGGRIIYRDGFNFDVEKP